MLHSIPLAYKFVLTTAIACFLNHFAGRLSLPIKVPLDKDEQGLISVMMPENKGYRALYGGGIRYSNYAIGFSDGYSSDTPSTPWGNFSISKLEDDGMESFGIPMLHLNEASLDLMERASKMPYTVSTNDLKRLATNYLNALELDQKAFEKIQLTTDKYSVFHSRHGPVQNPLMYIFWGNPELRNPGTNGFAVKLSAVSGQLLEMNVGNASGCKGLPLLKLEEFPKLLAITDEEFMKMSDTERTNLLYRFANNYLFPQPSTATNEATAK